MITPRCPICDKEMAGPAPAEWPQYPFCSDRCKLIDLGRWLGERYTVATEDDGDVADSEPETEIP